MIDTYSLRPTDKERKNEMVVTRREREREREREKESRFIPRFIATSRRKIRGFIFVI